MKRRTSQSPCVVKVFAHLYAHLYLVALTGVYVSSYLAQAKGQAADVMGGDPGPFDCNQVHQVQASARNVSHVVSKLKIASFNAEWLFDGKDDPRYSPWYPGKTSCPGKSHCGTEQGAQEHISKVSEYVRLVDADILNLVEVENCNVLREVISRSEISDYKPFLKRGVDTATQQNVALLTKFEPLEPLYRLESKQTYPIEGSTCGYESNTEKRTTLSKNYVAHYKINDMTVAFHGLHLKAYPKDPYSCAKREGQAKIAQASIRESIERGHEVVVFGDFNDFSYEHLDVQDDFPRSSVLSILRDMDSDGEAELINTMEFLEKGDRYTNWWDKNGNDIVDGNREYSQIDHVLLSQGLAKHVSKVEVFHGFDPAMVSDHFPLIVYFDFERQNSGKYEGGAALAEEAAAEEEGKGGFNAVASLTIGGVVALFIAMMAFFLKRKRRSPGVKFHNIESQAIELN